MARIIAVMFLLIGRVTSDLTVRQSVQESQSKNAIQFLISVENSQLLGSTAYDVSLVSNATGFAVNPHSIITDPQDDSRSRYVLVANEYVMWNYSQIVNGDFGQISYQTTPQFSLPEGKSLYHASLMYTVNPPINGTRFWGPILSLFCLERVNILPTETGFNKGLIAVTVVFGFLAGVFIALLILFAIYYLTKKNPFLCCKRRSTSSADSLQIKKSPSEFSGKVKKTKVTGKQEKNYFADGALPWTDSIITILRMSDKNNIVREIERLDIEDTERCYKELKCQKDEALTAIAINLVRNLDCRSKTKKSQDKHTTSLQNRLESVEKQMEDKFEEQTMNSKVSNRESSEKRLEAMSEKHNKELEFFMDYLNGKQSHNEIRPLRKLLAEKQQLEQTLLQYRVDLEDQECTQKTLSEIIGERDHIRRNLLMDYLRDVAIAASLMPERLLMEYDKLETTVQKQFLYSETVLYRSLQEKVARRKCLVKTQELSRIHGNDLLNAVTAQLVQLVVFAKKSGKLSQSNARRVREDVLAEAEDIKSHRDAEIEKREIDFLKKLGVIKKNQLLDKMKQHKSKLDELKMQGKVLQKEDLIDLIEAVQKSYTQHLQEMNELETKIDSDHASKLLQMHELLQDEMKQELLKSREALIKDLKEIGTPSTKMKPLLESLDNDLKELKQRHLKEVKEQLNLLKKQLSNGAIEFSGSRQQTFQIHDQLAAYKEAVTRKLLNGQIFLSSEERKQLENNVIKIQSDATVGLHALDKLKYRKMIEERESILERDQLEKLEQELKKKLRSLEKNQSGTSDDDEERNLTNQAIVLSLFENYFQQCLSVLKGEEIASKEEEEVNRELNKEQAEHLKEEEDALAEHLVRIQMNRVKQVVLLENQRNALHNVTSRLLEGLVERNVLSLSDCEKMLQLHEKELRTIAVHRNDDAKVNTLSETRKKELEEMLNHTEGDAPRHSRGHESTMAEKLDKILTIEDQIVKRNLVNNQLDREARQEAEELRRVDQLNEKQLILDKELEFLATVMKRAGYSIQEIETAIQSHSSESIVFNWRNLLDRYHSDDRAQHMAPERDLNHRPLHKPGKLHPLPSSVYPVPAYDEVDAATGTGIVKEKSYLYQKPHYINKERLSRTLPSHLVPITPSVGSSKQKKSVRLVEPPNEYWSN